MKVAIMQPYFFPYLGYFNLIAACDIFIFLDNVQYIRRGFVNKNVIIQPNGNYTFTIPLKSAPRNTLINQRKLAPEFVEFRRKFTKQLAAGYKKAPFYPETMELIESVFSSYDSYLSRLCESTILAVMDRIGIFKDVYTASEIMSQSESQKIHGVERIIHLVKKVKGDQYINPIGGLSLYRQESFQKDGIGLEFVRPGLPEYCQGDMVFSNSLSIIDVLMFNSQSQLCDLVNSYEIVGENK